MNMLPITYDFIDGNVVLLWCDVKWAYERKLIGWHVIVKHAENLVLLGESSQLELELSCKDKMDTHEINLILDHLVMHCVSTDEREAREKWLYIILLWLFIHRGDYSEPLEMVESIYADFDYPEIIKDFVRYMPIDDGYDPSMHSYIENTDRLYKKWETYLTQESMRFKK